FRRSWLAFLAWAIVAISVIYLFKTTPAGFIPSEDQRFVVINITLPPGSSLQRTQAMVNKIEKGLSEMPAVEHYFSIAGLNLLTNANSSNYGVVFVRLKETRARGEIQSIPDVINHINGR